MLVHQHLAPSADPYFEVIHLQCVQGREALSQYLGPANREWVTQQMMVGLTFRLAYPIILGRDWPDFTEVLYTANLGNPLIPMALEADNLEGRPGSGRTRTLVALGKKLGNLHRGMRRTPP